MYKKIIVASLTLAIIAGGAISTVFAGESNKPEKSGSNIVEIDSCIQHNAGITVGKFGEEPYFLANGIRDAGHGLRNYTLFCLGENKYKVDWVEVDEDNSPTPVEPEQNEPEAQPPVQPQFVHMTAFGNTAEYPLVLAKDSYIDHEGYVASNSFAEIQANVTQLDLRAHSTVQGANNSYAFAWVSSETNNLSFNEITARTLADSIQSTSQFSKTSFMITDFYRGKYVMVYAFVSNNDGISQVPNMPQEVDDVIPMYLYIKKLAVNLPIPLPEVPKVSPKVLDLIFQSCGNSQGGDGLYSACVGDSIKHDDATVLVTVKSYTDEYVVLNIRGANESQISVAKGGYHYITANSGTHLEISYTDTSEKHGAFIQMTEVGIM
jgi:hypothetical protein